MIGYAQPKVDLPDNLCELLLICDGSIARIRQVGGEWVAEIHRRNGDLERVLRAGTREELLKLVEGDSR